MSSRTVIKLNNIPHGFYEDQMRKYFSQFGAIKNVVLIRSKKTHKSRGFGFVEFYLAQVAKNAAEAMHNYLFFNHVLKCRQMDRNELPTNLFKINYKGPNNVQATKIIHNKPMREYKKLRQHYKKIQRIQLILKKLGIELKCHTINKPADPKKITEQTNKSS